MFEFRIVTLNTWNCQGSFDRRVPLMVDGLRELSADVTLLQEVYSRVPNGFDLGRHVGHELGWQVTAAPARKKFRTLDGQPVLCHSGLAILSKFPIKTIATVHLPEDPRDGERLGQIVRVDMKGIDLVVANVHLSHLHDGDDLRHRQLSSLLDHIPQTYDVLLLGGDMNMVATHPVLDGLCQDAGFIRADFTNGAEPQTSLNAVGATPPTGGVVDHLFIKAASDMRICARAQVALNTLHAEHEEFPSDHMAIAAQVALQTPFATEHTHDL